MRLADGVAAWCLLGLVATSCAPAPLRLTPVLGAREAPAGARVVISPSSLSAGVGDASTSLTGLDDASLVARLKTLRQDHNRAAQGRFSMVPDTVAVDAAFEVPFGRVRRVLTAIRQAGFQGVYAVGRSAAGGKASVRLVLGPVAPPAGRSAVLLRWAAPTVHKPSTATMVGTVGTQTSRVYSPYVYPVLIGQRERKAAPRRHRCDAIYRSHHRTFYRDSAREAATAVCVEGRKVGVQAVDVAPWGDVLGMAGVFLATPGCSDGELFVELAAFEGGRCPVR